MYARRRIVGLWLLATGLSLGGLSIASGAEPERPKISVGGIGKVSAVPDVAEISVGVVTQDRTASAALEANTEAMSKLMTLLKEGGIASKDVETVNLQISPVYSQPDPRRQQAGEEFVPRIVGYRVNNSIRVTVRRINSLGKLLDGVVRAGANEMYGIAFRVDSQEKLLDEARRRAMADAKRKAELLAGEAGVVLGKPLAIRESSSEPVNPQPMFMSGRAAMAAAVPTAAGEQELTASVQVDYAISEPK